MNQQHYIVITTQEEREEFGPVREGVEWWDFKIDQWKQIDCNRIGGNLCDNLLYRFPVASAPGWISLKERMPTAADADKYGQAVFFTNIGRQTIAPWRCEGFRANVFTHFRPFTPPPAPKELTQEEKDEALYAAYCEKTTSELHSDKLSFFAGLRIGREQASTALAKVKEDVK